MKSIALAAALMAPAIAPAAAYAQPVAKPAYLDTRLAPKARAADLVSRMTLEEKAPQLLHFAPAIPRLGVPAYNWWSEGLHGVARAGEATVFPQAIGLAATFDTPLMHTVADTISTEFRAKYAASVAADGGSEQYRGLTVWSPNINIFRDPRWGRGQETYGEDPYLTARMGVAFVKGLQGDDPKHYKTIATAKHFAVHSGPEADRHKDDIHPSAHDLEDTYLPAFKAAVVEGKAGEVMCAYNAIDGAPACANNALLQDRLRGKWGFDGVVVSDCAAVADFYLPTSHAWVKTPEEAMAAALKADTDLVCDFVANGTADPGATMRAVREGLVSEIAVDAALVRLFEARMRLGLFDPPAEVSWSRITKADVDTPEHRALSLEAARKAMVLLKNDGLLPLRQEPRRIAVIGPNADSLDALVGNYNGTPSKPVTVLAGLKARFPKAQVTYVEGTGWVAPPLEYVPDAALCVDQACTAKGLKQDEFKGAKLEGAAVNSTTVANASFNWGRPNREERDSSIRWSGYIRPQETGPYRFRFTGDDGYRVYIDDKLIANVWDIAWPTSDSDVTLQAGRTYKLTVEAAQKGGREDQRLQWSRPSAGDSKALDAARDADLVVFAGGLTARLEGEEMRVAAPGFAGGDRTSLDLPAPQERLLERLHGLGKPVVLVLMNGSAMSVNWADAHIPAILEAWYPGEEGGTAIASLIAGDFSPAGRLPVTFYRSDKDLPAFKDYSMAGRTYRYFGGEALYPFGYGLSYTRFSYGRLMVSPAVKAGEPTKLAVEIANTGQRDGDEVVQVYVTRTDKGAPIRSLQGFQRVTLKAGEAKTVRFVLDPMALSVVDEAGVRRVSPGDAQIWVGGGQPTARPGLAKPAGAGAAVAVHGSAVIEN